MSDIKSDTFSFSKILKSKKAPVIVGILFLVLIAAVGLYIAQSSSNNKTETDQGKVLYSIDGREFHERELNKLILYPTEVGGLTRQQALQLSFESYKKIIVGEKANVKPSDSVVDSYLKETVPPEIAKDPAKKDKYLDWFKMLAAIDAIEASIDDRQPAISYSGYSHVFFFGQHLDYGDDSKPEGFNDPALVAKDKAYAKEKADYYHQQLVDGKMTNDAIDKAVRADPKLQNIVTTKNPFGKDDAMKWQDDIFYRSIVGYIQATSKTGISDVLTGSYVPGPGTNSTDQLVDMYYYFVDVDSAPPTGHLSTSDYHKNIASIKSMYYTDYDIESYPFTADNVKQQPTVSSPVQGAEN